MFAKLAFKNIKRSIKDYAIYFFTLVLGVAIFYVFNSLESQSVMLDVTDRVRDMLDLINVLMGIVSVFVACILGALIIYASRFLIKRRSKEFGIYLTLGMSKRKISLILILETFLIGLLSLAVGLVLGVIASQFTSVLVANMFEADLTNFQFVFSFSAMLQTMFYFGIIYLIVMIFNTINISRQKLINLLSSSRRNEKIRNKNLWICTIVFIIAAVVLGYAYYLVTDGLQNLVMEGNGPEVLLIPITMGIVSTFLLFWSLSGILLRIVMSFKKVYYNKLNSFILRQFSSKINTTVASMSVICLMLFVTICVLGSAISINASLSQDIARSLPRDAMVEGMGEGYIDVKEIYRREDLNLDDILTDIAEYQIYRIETPTDKQYFESDAAISPTVTINQNEDGSFISEEYSISERYIHASDYNKMAEIFSLPTVELAKDEYAILANYQQIVEIRNAAMKKGLLINLPGNTLKPKYDQCIDGAIRLEVGNANEGLIIVPDHIDLAKNAISSRQVLLGNYKNPEQADELAKMLEQVGGRFFSDDGEQDGISGAQDIYYYNVETKQSIIDNNVGTSALVTFVGLYLGVIFLISSAAVLALKELSESSDNRSKYTTLRKIGASNSMLNRALFWQIFIFFLFPLLIAILHSVFGLMFCDFMLATLGGVNITATIPTVSAILLAIYGGYFLITYFCSRNIIREHRN